MAVSGGGVAQSLVFGEATLLISLNFSYSLGFDSTRYRQRPESSYIFKDVLPINVLFTKYLYCNFNFYIKATTLLLRESNLNKR